MWHDCFFLNVSLEHKVMESSYTGNHLMQLMFIINIHVVMSYEPRREKTGFLHMRKTQISFAVTAKLISAFVFATRIVQSLYYLNPKFQASSHLLWLYSLVCVGPGWKPQRPVFSQRGSYYLSLIVKKTLSLRLSSRSGTNQAVQPKKMVAGLKI